MTDNARTEDTPYVCDPGKPGRFHELSYQHPISTGYDRRIGEMVDRGTCRCGLDVVRFVFEGQRPSGSRVGFFPADRLASVVAELEPKPFGPAPRPANALDYTSDQRDQTIELWRRLLDSHVTRVHAPSEYGHGAWPIEITDERLAELVDADGEPADEYRVPVTVVLASYGDYGGSSYDAANVRTLNGHPGVSTSTGGVHGEGSAEITLGTLPGDESDDVATGIEWLIALVEMIDGLSDYPVIDESDLGEYESELADEAWDQWVERDVMSDLRGMLETVAGDDWESAPDPTDRADEVRTAYYSFEDNEWVCESATSATNMRHDEALQHVARTVFGLSPYWVVRDWETGEAVPAEFDSEDAARRFIRTTNDAERAAGRPYREYRTQITARA
jgi:hypothetical protein